MDTLLDKVRVRLLESAEERVFHYFKKLGHRASTLKSYLKLLGEHFEQLKVAVGDCLKGVDRRHQEGILSEV